MPPAFHYVDSTLWIESLPVARIVSEIGTPCYLYSKSQLLHQANRFKTALKSHPHRIFYATKANSTLGILQTIHQAGLGFDIVSGGELARVLKAGAPPQNIVFSGVGKSIHEIETALKAGIGCFNVESKAELTRITEIASRLNQIAPIALRVNPDISAESHPYISTGLKENKFGIAFDAALPLFKEAHRSPHLKLTGVACHIGSQITQTAPFVAAVKKLSELIQQLTLEGISLSHINLGGGLGVQYDTKMPPTIETYLETILAHWPDPQCALWIEPGRALIAEAGILVSKVEYLKQHGEKHFCIIDAGMNDLLRPALYQAHHRITALQQNRNCPTQQYDIVGPICESSDTFGQNVSLNIQPGDYLAIHTVGAYGTSMSSNYNSRCRAAEALVEEETFHIIRYREKIDDLFSHEPTLSD